MLKWLALPALAVIAMLGATPQAEAAAGYATGDVNMRTGPSTRYARIITIPGGAPVEIYGCSGSWCDTQYAGYRGWVSGNYLSSGGYRYRSASPGGAAVAGIIGLGVAGAILADRYDDRRYYRYRHHPRYHWRHRHHPRHHWRHRHHRHWGHYGHRQRFNPRAHWHR